MRYSLLPSGRTSPHYAALLVALLILIVVTPLLPGARGAYAVEFLFDMVLVASAYSVVWQSKHRVPFLAFTVVTLVLRWTDVLSDHVGYTFASLTVTVVWITYAVVLIVGALFRMRRATTNAIFGAIVTLLLTAVAFGFLFELIELSKPGSFSGIPAGGTEREVGDALLYYSFVCLTTMGYGDIVPVSNLARRLSVLEGVFGLIYLAVTVARLVGLQVSSGGNAEEASR